MNETINHPYLYRPIAAFNGAVLKCCGMASDTSRAIVQAHADGTEKVCQDSTLVENGVVVETAIYMGDRINAADLSPFKG